MLDEKHLPRVVLMRPGNPANIGFVARALSNFGVEDWVAVAPPELRGSEAEKTGAPARETLDTLRTVASLPEALKECTHVLGFTARSGKHRRSLSVTELSTLQRKLGPEARPALLFGREDRGLEADETALCTDLITIPTRGLASLNLSHAVTVALYEWFRDEDSTGNEFPEKVRWSKLEEKTRLRGKIEAALEKSGYPLPDQHLGGALSRLLALPVEARDLRVLERIIRHADWCLDGKGNPGS